MSNRTILTEGEGGRRILRAPGELEEHDRKEYCTQNGGDCSTCSLVNYGRDCRNVRLDVGKRNDLDAERNRT